MNKIKLLLMIILSIALSIVLIIFFEDGKTNAKEMPQELYQVYLDGEKVGVIRSKAALESYISDKQEEVKKKYSVDKVYPPNNLNIQKYIGYESNILSEKEVYEIIKEKNPFTIKGYVITIKKDPVIKINVLDKNIFSKAADTTIEAFVSKEDYMMFRESTQPEIKTTGKRIEDLYIEEEITIKKTYIPIDQKIFVNEKELAKYLLFGSLSEQRTYVVKPGDTIETISFDNKLAVDEFLIVNPQFNNPNNLLFVGEQVKVGLISPIFSVVVEEHVVEDSTIKYKTDIVYDNTLAYGKSYVRQEGIDGLERVTQKRKIVNGEITNVGFKGTPEVLKYAVNKVVVKGTKTNSGNVIIPKEGGWVWPTNTPYIITSRYGYRWGRLHDGIDIAGPGSGSPIYAANNGAVYITEYGHRSLGNYVIIQHANGYFSVYAHMSKILVKEGQTVTGGQRIGSMGSTGHSTGTHLHLSVFIGIPYKTESRSFNPMLLY